MTVIAAIVTDKFSIIGSDSRTFIAGASSNSVVDHQKSKITRIRCGDGEYGLLGYAGDFKYESEIIALLMMHGSPANVPSDSWPEDSEDSTYESVYVCPDGAWLIMGKNNIVSYQAPCCITCGSGGELAQGSVLTQTWRRKNLSNLREAQARKIIRRALQVACKIDVSCGGRITIKKI